MSFTPGARAYGAVDDFFAGAINRMGWQIEPGATIMATWGSKETNLADALKAPALVLNVYAPPSAADDTFDQYLFDVIWGSTGAELEEFGVQITGELARNLEDPKAFVIVVNQVCPAPLPACLLRGCESHLSAVPCSACVQRGNRYWS